ncbi:MAG: lysoplasmalogenase [Clostridia bacterium]|nr:lysoplasmalogenase [Clostridia bacterium]
MYHKITRKFHVINILLMIGAVAGLIYYDVHGGIFLKGMTSLWFVVIGAVNLLYGHKTGCKNNVYPRWIAAGLLFGMCADVLLQIEFLLGVAVFALGHLLYLVAFYAVNKPNKRDLCFVLPIVLVSLFLLLGTPFIQINDAMMRGILVGYALIISGMFGKVASNRSGKKGTFVGLALLGAAMFWFSDLMLAVSLFGKSSRLVWILCSYTYWPAQSILAYSMFHYITEQTTD